MKGESPGVDLVAIDRIVLPDRLKSMASHCEYSCKLVPMFTKFHRTAEG